jgi:hypothetical protein
MKNVLIIAAVGEAATGLVFMIVPSLVPQLLFGQELTGVAVPVALAQGVPSKTPGLQHKVSKKRHPGISGYAQMQARSKKGYPGALGYRPETLDRETEITRQAGGGGGM